MCYLSLFLRLVYETSYTDQIQRINTRYEVRTRSSYILHLPQLGKYQTRAEILMAVTIRKQFTLKDC
jgi:hypothetical protein